MTLSQISAQKQQLEQKHIRNMQKVKAAYIFELVVAVFIAIVDMRTSTSENPVASGFIILLVLAAIVSAWNALVYFSYKRGKENEIAKLNAAERRLEEQQKRSKEQQEARARTRAAQEALISLSKLAEQEQNKRPTNCPNCGALLHSSVCEYCGTQV